MTPLGVAQKIQERNLVNLSPAHIPLWVRAALMRNVDFIPTPNNTKLDKAEELFSTFRRRIGWARFWAERDPSRQAKEDDQQQQQQQQQENKKRRTKKEEPGKKTEERRVQFRPKKFFVSTGRQPPKKAIDPIEETLEKMHERFIKITTTTIRPPRRNFPIRWLRQLQEWCKKVVIKKADKSGGLVVMSHEGYRSLVEAHLKDTKVYTKVGITEDQAVEFACKKVKELIKEWYENNPTTVEDDQPKLWRSVPVQFLLSTATSEASIARFYCLPKLHKTPVKGRPIAGAPTWPTNAISRWLAEQLKAHTMQYNTVLKSTKDLLQELDETQIKKDDDKILLVTMDVTAMYPSISHQVAREAIREELKACTPPLEASTINFAMAALNMMLATTYVEFSGQVYHQKQGLPMGSPSSPEIANLVLARAEHSFFSQLPPTDRRKFALFKRFIDDGLAILQDCSDEDFGRLKEKFTSHVEEKTKLKLTWETSRTSVPFMDLVITRKQGTNKLHTRVFSKPSYMFQYIPASSFHPAANKKGWIKGETIRLVLAHSELEGFKTALQNFNNFLLCRGYAQTFIKSAMKDVKYSNRQEYLQGQGNKKEGRVIAMTLPHTPATHQGREEARRLRDMAKEVLPSGARVTIATTIGQKMGQFVTTSRNAAPQK